MIIMHLIDSKGKAAGTIGSIIMHLIDSKGKATVTRLDEKSFD